MTLYIIILIPFAILSIYAQFKVRSTYNRYLSFQNGFGITGSDIARIILNENGLKNIKVEKVDGILNDHYEPRDGVIRLSSDVYNGSSISAIGVAAHESGHAIQHNEKYLPLIIRSSLEPAANVGSLIAIPLIILGLIIKSLGLIIFGIILFSMIVLFQLITLPVEFNASRRAVEILKSRFLTSDELVYTKKVLNAAALTYVAASTASIEELIRHMIIFFANKNEKD